MLTTKIAPQLILLGGAGLDKQSEALWHTLTPNVASITICPAALLHHKVGVPEHRAKTVASSLSDIFDHCTVITAEELFRKKALSTLAGSDAIYLTDGSPKTLLTNLQNTPLSDLIFSDSADHVLITAGGASAALGSIIAFPDTPLPPVLNTLTFSVSTGLSVFPDTLILPYFDWLPSLLITQIKSALLPGINVIGIDTHAALVHTSSGWEVAGEGAVTFWHSGESNRIVINESQALPHNFLTFS